MWAFVFANPKKPPSDEGGGARKRDGGRDIKAKPSPLYILRIRDIIKSTTFKRRDKK